MSNNRRMSKTRRSRIEKDTNHLVNTRFDMKPITPITETQKQLFSSFKQGKNILAVGSAGTGKTYISLYLALRELIDTNQYTKILIVRSSVQSREQGHMPGSATEKMAYFETPYSDIVNDLYGRGDAYQILKQKGMINFMSTSFIRGLTFDNSLIIVDECQNMNWGEIRTIMTRVGDNSRIIFCGDTKQDDLISSRNKADNSGLYNFKKVIDKMGSDCFRVVEFTSSDIVRSGVVKEFIIAEEQLELT